MAAVFEEVDDVFVGLGSEVEVEDVFDGFAGDAGEEFVFVAGFFGEGEFDFASGGGVHRSEVGDADDGVRLAEFEGAAFGVRDDVLQIGDGHADGDAGGLIDVGADAGETGCFFDDFFDEVGDVYFDCGVTFDPGVFVGDLDAEFAGEWVVRADDGTDAVFEGGDDAAAVGVIFGVGGEDQAEVEGETDGEAADLDVAFFEDVEETDLDFGGEVGEFVHAEDAAVRAGNEAEVHDVFVGEVTSFGVFDEVDFSYEVGNGDVGGGEFFVVAVVTFDPFDGGFVAVDGELVFGVFGEGVERIVVDVGARDDGEVFVEEAGEHAEDAGLALPSQAEEEHVVLGEDGVFDLGEDGVVVAHDAGEEGFAATEFAEEVVAHFDFDGAGFVAG